MICSHPAQWNTSNSTNAQTSGNIDWIILQLLNEIVLFIFHFEESTQISRITKILPGYVNDISLVRHVRQYAFKNTELFWHSLKWQTRTLMWNNWKVLYVLIKENFGRIGLNPGLLIVWRLKEPGNHKQYYWWCKIGRFLWNSSCHLQLSVRNFIKCT